jgi:alcohol dehydrogenase
MCLMGATGVCESVPSISAFGMGLGWGGALSDLLRVPFADTMLVPLADEVDATLVASAADNLSDAYRLVAPQLERLPNAEVLVVAGRCASVGLYAVAMARALGASAVDYVDADPDRRAIASRLGARMVARPWREPPQLYPIVIDASAGRSGLSLAIRCAGANGVVASAGIYFWKRTPIPMLPMYTRGISLITGVPSVRVVIPKVLSLIASGRLDIAPVVSRVSDFADAHEAFLEPAAKVVVARRR